MVISILVAEADFRQRHESTLGECCTNAYLILRACHLPISSSVENWGSGVVNLEQRNLFTAFNSIDDQLALRLQFSAVLHQAFGHSVAIANALAIGL